ncbi:MAG: cytochrome b [Hyphomonadaceae bacterium]|jgi:cytochrome b561|nr:cytochrome b [Hyphomonadaceae bacterium]
MAGLADQDRYTRVAIILHWLIAVLLIGNLAGGMLMDFLPREQKFAVIQLHKSSGFTVLALSLARIAWRLGHKPPALPATMAGWERAAASFAHGFFYFAMIAMPLSGWVMASSAPYKITTEWFGLFEIPNVPGLADSPDRKAINEAAYETHELIAYGTIALIVLHAGAALKHHFKDRDGVLARMLPMVARR